VNTSSVKLSTFCCAAIVSILTSAPSTLAAPTGDLFVSSGSPVPLIAIVDPSLGSTVGAWVAYGQPSGLAFDPSGNLYEADSRFGDVIEFGPNGTNLGRFSSIPASETGYTEGIAFDPNGKLYEATTTPIGSGVVYQISSSGGLASQSFGGLLNGSNPTGIAFDPNGNLYVAISGANKIHKVSAAGTNLGDFASGLSSPAGIAFDSSGNLYAANFQSNTIEKFSPTGVDLGAFAGPSAGLNGPFGLAFDNDGILWVSNYRGGTIEKLNAAGTNVGLVSVGNGFNPTFIAFAPVPEPSTLTLLALGGVGVIVCYACMGAAKGGRYGISYDPIFV
jgi:sugar lactone lactonase YvrE